MSALAKPLVKFSTAKNPTAVVGAEYIVDIAKLDTTALPNQPGNTAQHFIVVNYVFPNSNTKTAKIEFATVAIRDTAFAAFETLVCATI